MRRVLILSDPTRGMGALAAAECDRIVRGASIWPSGCALPVEWVPISSGARIAMDSGTENLDATARVVRRIVTFTQHGGVIHVIVTGVNVGAQSYWDALATMLMHTRGVLIMTPQASMVLTGRRALEAVGLGRGRGRGRHRRLRARDGSERSGAVLRARSGRRVPHALRALRLHLRRAGRARAAPPVATTTARERDVTDVARTRATATDGFAHRRRDLRRRDNPGRKRPFAMRAVMRALVDADGGYLERWRSHGRRRDRDRLGRAPRRPPGLPDRHREPATSRARATVPLDGPSEWNGGTLFPQSSKKVARALNAASGNRPVVILANLSGFDGSPESMRKLQLEYGAEIARAVVNFDGPLLFLVVSRYHGGAYVVFSHELNAELRAAALEGSYASVIGGGPAATVVFAREVRARVGRSRGARRASGARCASPTRETRDAFDRALAERACSRRARRWPRSSTRSTR